MVAQALCSSVWLDRERASSRYRCWCWCAEGQVAVGQLLPPANPTFRGLPILAQESPCSPEHPLHPKHLLYAKGCLWGHQLHNPTGTCQDGGRSGGRGCRHNVKAGLLQPHPEPGHHPLKVRPSCTQHVPLWPEARAVETAPQSSKRDPHEGQARPGRLGRAGVGVRCVAHLQGSRVVLHLRQPLPDLPVGHGAAQGIVRALQQPQLLLMLLQSLEVAAWRAGGRRAAPVGRPGAAGSALARATAPVLSAPSRPPRQWTSPPPDSARGTHHGWPAAPPAGDRARLPLAAARWSGPWLWPCSALQRENEAGKLRPSTRAGQTAPGTALGRSARGLTSELSVQAHRGRAAALGSGLPALPRPRPPLPRTSSSSPPRASWSIPGSVVRPPEASWEL